MRARAFVVPAVGLALLWAGLARTQQAEEPRAILERAIKAHGGADTLKKVQAGRSKAKGKIEILGGAEFTQSTAFQHPDKFRDEMELEVAGQKVKVITIWNGTDGSIEANGQKVPVDDKIKEALKQGGDMIRTMRLVGLLERGYEVSALGEAQVNGNPAVGVRITKEGQRDLNIFFDKKTGLTAKLEHRVTDQMTGQEVTEERIVLEYQRPNEIPFAKRVLINRDGKKFIEAEVLEVQMLERIDDAEFAVQQ